MFKQIFFAVTICFSFSLQASPKFSKVFIIVLENTDYSKAMAQPFLSELSKRGASLDNMTALTHPSQGNYISMIGGDTFGITNDKNIDLDAQHIGDLLEAKGLTWKVYAEDYPENCFLGVSSGDYARKHVPFLSFTNVTSNPKRCANIVNAKQLDADIKSQNLPNYSIYVPNMKNDGHNTGAPFSDAFVAKKFGPLLKNSIFMDQMLLVVTFDESGSKGNNNQIYTALIGDSVIAGSSSKNAYTHYSILKTIESEWGLGDLGKQDKAANFIIDVLK